ncbi:MAG: hypothetical protein HY920_07400 [Elusimicrobia bacterium]|nr:hypothetical protein [Elusimicrobiota bacterium]
MADKKEIGGLVKLAGWIFYGWGVLVTLFGFLRLLNINKPDSEFVTTADWLRFSVFQITYGMVCVGVGYLLFLFIKKKIS